MYKCAALSFLTVLYCSDFFKKPKSVFDRVPPNLNSLLYIFITAFILKLHTQKDKNLQQNEWKRSIEKKIISYFCLYYCHFKIFGRKKKWIITNIKVDTDLIIVLFIFLLGIKVRTITSPGDELITILYVYSRWNTTKLNLCIDRWE